MRMRRGWGWGCDATARDECCPLSANPGPLHKFTTLPSQNQGFTPITKLERVAYIDAGGVSSITMGCLNDVKPNPRLCRDGCVEGPGGPGGLAKREDFFDVRLALDGSSRPFACSLYKNNRTRPEAQRNAYARGGLGTTSETLPASCMSRAMVTSIAAMSALALLTVSWYSLAGSLSATSPAPAWT